MVPRNCRMSIRRFLRAVIDRAYNQSGMRHVDHVLVVPNTTVLKCLDRIRNGAEQRFETHTKRPEPACIAAVDRANKLAAGIYGSRPDISVETPPGAVL